MLFVQVSEGLGVWIGVGCPCPPVRNDIVTPRHLLHYCSYPTIRDWIAVYLALLSRNTPQIRLTCFSEDEQNAEIENGTGSLQTDNDVDEPVGPNTESTAKDTPVSKHVLMNKKLSITR